MPTITIPEKYAQALKDAVANRKGATAPSISMTGRVNAVIRQFKVEYPHLFREQEDGSVAPRISVK